MADRIPKGKLFSPRKYGRYGNYITWNMIKALALMAKPPSDKTPIWTAKAFADEIGMAKQSALLMLERMKDMQWVEWGKNANGKQSWVILSTGMASLKKELHRRVNFEIAANEDESAALLGIAERACRMINALKEFGWHDVQARECLINHKLHKIEWAVAKSRRNIVINKGAYARSLIENGNMDERRCRIYVEKVCPKIAEPVRDMVVKEALRTTEPFEATKKIMYWLKEYMGKPDKDLTKNDVGEILFALYQQRKVKINERASLRFVG